MAHTIAPFARECAAIISDTRAAELGLRPFDDEFPAAEYRVSDEPGLGWEPFLGESREHVGSFSCAWGSEDLSETVLVEVVPSAAITSEVRAAWPAWFTGECFAYSVECNRLLEANGVVVHLTAGSEMSDLVVGEIEDALASTTSPVMGELPSDAWTELITCDTVNSVVQDWFPGENMVPGVPTDFVAFGPLDEGVAVSAPYLWCPMWANDESGGIIAVIQPGVGEPGSSALEGLLVTDLTLPGADKAWLVQGMAGIVTAGVVAVVDSNRVTVTAGSLVRSEEEMLGLAQLIAGELIARHQ